MLYKGRKILAFFVAIIMVISTLSAGFSAFAKTYPYIDVENSLFYNSEEISFAMNYTDMIKSLQYALENRQVPSEAENFNYMTVETVDDYSISLTYHFATDFSDLPEYQGFAYDYNDKTDYNTGKEEIALNLSDQFAKQVYDDVIYDENGLGNGKIDDYVFKSFALTSTVASFSPNEYDVVDGTQYYSYRFEYNLTYYTTLEQEQSIENFAKVFSYYYLSDEMTDYSKVKTIYDFVVRNTEYDYDVYNGKYQTYKDENNVSILPERYRISHSAYGALFGNLIEYNSNGDVLQNNADSYDYNYKNTIVEATDNESQKVIANADQGLAVCEGFSKLFYYLCNYNNINCRIVDGDYIEKSLSNHDSDPHEWNYVYLDDNSGDGYKWFQIDTTFASQQSFKSVDFNSYSFFLCGSDNAYFSVTNHQIAYGKSDLNYAGTSQIKQLYDWFWPENASSVEDYKIELIDFSSVIADDTNENYQFMIERKTDYGEDTGVRYAFVLYSWSCADEQILENGKKLYSISSDKIEDLALIQRYENEDVAVTSDKIEGFTYTGNTAEFNIYIPYVCSRSYVATPTIVENSLIGKYTVGIEGDTTSFNAEFKITPLDMSNTKNYEEITVTDVKGNTVNLSSNETLIKSYYTAKEITPTITVTDGYKNDLKAKNGDKENDYNIVIYYCGAKLADKKNSTVVNKICDRGYYIVSVVYYGNYKGTFDFNFFVDKTLLSMITQKETFQLDYFPKYYREKYGISSPCDYFNENNNAEYKAQFNLSLLDDDGNLGEILYPLVDFVATDVSGDINFNSSGTVKLTALSSSSKVIGKSSLSDNITDDDLSTTANFVINKKFDISSSNLSFDGGYADSNKVNKYYYTGSEIMPVKFDFLDTRLEKDVDYEIVSYSNNINAGDAYVTIKGINGCTGTATMRFVINPANIGTAKVTASYSNSNLSVTVKYDGDTLVENKDYTKSVKSVAEDDMTKYTITISGIGNFSGGLVYTYSVNTTIPQGTVDNRVKPTASGNVITLSKSSYTYDGSAKKPNVVFKNSNGKKIDSYYYTVSYSNNKKPGTATVKIKMRNGYNGTFTKTFKISVAPTTLSKLKASSKAFTAYWNKKSSSNITGYQIQYSTSSSFKNAKTVTVSSYKTSSKKIKSLKSKKKYYVRIRCYKTISGKKYYSTWSKAKTITTKK